MSTVQPLRYCFGRNEIIFKDAFHIARRLLPLNKHAFKPLSPVVACYAKSRIIGKTLEARTKPFQMKIERKCFSSPPRVRVSQAFYANGNINLKATDPMCIRAKLRWNCILLYRCHPTATDHIVSSRHCALGVGMILPQSLSIYLHVFRPGRPSPSLLTVMSIWQCLENKCESHARMLNKTKQMMSFRALFTVVVCKIRVHDYNLNVKF